MVKQWYVLIVVPSTAAAADVAVAVIMHVLVGSLGLPLYLRVDVTARCCCR